jgi:hypothetical protein
VATYSEPVDALVPHDGRPVRSGLLTLSSIGGDLRMVTNDYREGYTKVVVEVDLEGDGAWRVTGTVEQIEAPELHCALRGPPSVADDDEGEQEGVADDDEDGEQSESGEDVDEPV